MQNNAPQSCDYDVDVSSTNFRLCSDNSFIDRAAIEIYTSCGCGVLTASAQTLYAICTDYAPGTLQFTMSEIVYADDGEQSVCGNGQRNVDICLECRGGSLSSFKFTNKQQQP